MSVRRASIRAGTYGDGASDDDPELDLLGTGHSNTDADLRSVELASTNGNHVTDSNAVPNTSSSHPNAGTQADSNSHAVVNADVGSTEEMKKLFALLVLILCVLSSGVMAQNFNFPDNPTLNQIVTGPNGQEFQWDGHKWNALSVPGNFLPKNDPTYTGLLTGPTLSVTGNATITGNLNVSGITTHNSAIIPTLAVTQNLQISSDQGANLLFAGFPMGGTCPGGEYVNALSATGKLTCAAGGGGAFLPLTGGTLTGSLGIGAAATTYSLEITKNHNDETALSITNTDAGGAASSALWLNNGPDWAGFMLNGTGFTGDPRLAYLWSSSGTAGLRLQADNGAITFNLGGTPIAQFQRGGIQGLNIYNNSTTGLSVGDYYLASVGIGNFNMVGGAYYDGANWMASNTLPGYALINNISGVGIGFYSAGAGVGGQAIPGWNKQATIGPNGLAVSHIENEQSYGVPWCENCAGFAGGSRDTDGYVQVISGGGAWPITIHFARAFTGTVACVGSALVGASLPGGWITFSYNSPTQITLDCWSNTSTHCSTTGANVGWVAYHCMGTGG